jgi:hypothetical protein
LSYSSRIGLKSKSIAGIELDWMSHPHSRETVCIGPTRFASQRPIKPALDVTMSLTRTSSPKAEVGEVLDDSWGEELDRRLADWEADPSTDVPWSEPKSQQ